MGRDIVLLFQNPNSTGPTRDAYINEAAHIKTTGDSPPLSFSFSLRQKTCLCVYVNVCVRERDYRSKKCVPDVH